MSADGRDTLAGNRLLRVLDGASVLMYVQDPDGRIVHANRAACDLVGKPPEEVVGRLPSELFDPATVERWTDQNREVMRTGRPIDVEDGWGGRTHLTTKTPVYDAEGKPAAVIGISTDITDRKRAEDALRRSESNLAEAQQIAGVGSWHWNVATGALPWSTELHRIYGIPPGRTPTADEVRRSSTRTTVSPSASRPPPRSRVRRRWSSTSGSAAGTASSGCSTAAPP